MAVAAVVFLLKITLASRTYGTNDVMTWERDLVKFRTRGAAALYREGVGTQQAFIHPPFVIHLLRFWGFLSDISPLPLGFWMRLTCAIADLGSLALVWKIGGQRRMAFRPAALLLFAACPISVLISGFHGNTDPIMIFLVLSSVYAIETGKPSLLGGALMGLALSIKLAPLIFIPAAILYLPRTRDRVYFIICCVTAFALSGIPYVLDMVHNARTLLSYRSVFGSWGWPLFLSLDDRVLWIRDGFRRYGEAALLISTAVLSVGLNVPKIRLPLFTQCGLIAALFLFFTPGFGAQYLTWLVPWVVCLSPLAAAAYYLSGGAFLFVSYTHQSGGFPWYFANSYERPWSVSIAVFGLICWATVGVVLFLLCKRLRFREWKR